MCVCVTGEEAAAAAEIKSAVFNCSVAYFQSVRQKECIHYNGHACLRACYAQSAVLGRCDLERHEESLTQCAGFTRYLLWKICMDDELPAYLTDLFSFRSLFTWRKLTHYVISQRWPSATSLLQPSSVLKTLIPFHCPSKHHGPRVSLYPNEMQEYITWDGQQKSVCVFVQGPQLFGSSGLKNKSGSFWNVFTSWLH